MIFSFFLPSKLSGMIIIIRICHFFFFFLAEELASYQRGEKMYSFLFQPPLWLRSEHVTQDHQSDAFALDSNARDKQEAGLGMVVPMEQKQQSRFQSLFSRPFCGIVWFFQAWFFCLPSNSVGNQVLSINFLSFKINQLCLLLLAIKNSDIGLRFDNFYNYIYWYKYIFLIEISTYLYMIMWLHIQIHLFTYIRGIIINVQVLGIFNTNKNYMV